MTTIILIGFGTLEVTEVHAKALLACGKRVWANGLTKCKVPATKANSYHVVYLSQACVARVKQVYVNDSQNTLASAVLAAMTARVEAEAVQEQVAEQQLALEEVGA